MTPTEWISLSALAIGAVNGLMLVFRTGRSDSKAEGANLERIVHLDQRVSKCETAVQRTSEALAELSPAIAALTEKIANFDRFVLRDLDEVKHGLRNLRSGQEGLLNRLLRTGVVGTTHGD